MAIKVSQATIDKIKKQGMTAALKGASKANAETLEGLKRMYGTRRVSAAMGKSTAPKYTSPDAARAANAPVRYKSADAARSAATSSMSSKVTKPKPKPKTSSAYASPTDKVYGVSVADWRKAYGAPVNSPKPKVKTAAEKAAEAKAKAARRKAMEAAVKAANGRTH